MTTVSLSLAISPEGRVHINPHLDKGELLDSLNANKIQSLFADDSVTGLLHLGLQNIEPPLPPSICFWQKFSRIFINKLLSTLTEGENLGLKVPYPSIQELEDFLADAPFLTGSEYLNLDVLVRLWKDLESTTKKELTAFNGNVQDFLKAHNPQWGLVGCVHFHLAENKASLDTPFAFLATYTTSLSTSAKVQHLPLGRALQEYSGQKKALLSLLMPVQRAAEQSPLIKEMVDSGRIFQSLAWRPQEAHRFLQAIPAVEAAGIIVRVPNWWSPKHPPKAQVSVSIGKNKSASIGLEALLDLNVEMILPDGGTLTEEEWQTVLSSSENLVLIKGKWVEVDKQKLEEVLKHWNKVKSQVASEGISFSEAMRLLAGASYGETTTGSLPKDSKQWSKVIAGKWLAEILTQLRNPDAKENQQLIRTLKKDLHADLRPYQITGVNWLWLLYTLKLGGCLADDMGLGKTIQVLSLLLLIKSHSSLNKPHLLIVPASLLSNWLGEISRFAPSLKVLVAHSSLSSSTELEKVNEENLTNYKLVITTYTFLQRLEWLQKANWDVLVLDEAQLIKNPLAKQTQCVKTLKCRVRLALTGTPVENRLGDLWSLFDFICPGLLGSLKSFNNYVTKNSTEENHFYGTIRKLVSPYILRRLKSDKTIINDLPDKTELKVFCSLSKRQISLYQQSLEELVKRLEVSEGIQRRGIILSYLTRFKQICNHPTQWLGHGSYDLQESGKFLRLKAICEEISEKQEKVLVFTQFREIMPVLTELLAGIFDRPGLMLHGQTPIKERGKLVEQFNTDLGPPFFVLSIKAGGTGLNLTKASHVIHFDRWWNPAVEDQATDRAYRIGQRKNVLVHKFICRGTIEDKIDTLIESKKDLSQQLLEGVQELLMTELSNEELIKVVSLDIHRVLEESEPEF